ncbi:MAG: methionyl-tRNA formyltransferase [Gemmatimonas sp. 13_1_20CM_3_60_15]|nr:MAG: methionyl-tRNA formyltransferase [Gemmatimonas sp. 13_1_20CM_3_60_15]
MRVVFWGTPDFAAPSLRALIGEGFDVVAVVTQPDKPRGRAREIIPSPIKQIALDEELTILQPKTARDLELYRALEKLEPDVSVVVAYGHILPQKIIDVPKLGTLNIHASLLPLLRGAAPIQAAILEGFTETGVTVMRVVQQLDAGPMILQAEAPIVDDETYGELQERLSELGALTLVEALTLFTLGKANERPQDESRATFAPKITREMARIDWRNSALEISRQIRAFDPKPGAFSKTPKGDVKMFGPKVMDGIKGKPGEVLKTKAELIIACGVDALRIAEVQPAGKHRMAAHEWTRGRGAEDGDSFGEGS